MCKIELVEEINLCEQSIGLHFVKSKKFICIYHQVYSMKPTKCQRVIDICNVPSTQRDPVATVIDQPFSV